jgi:hypothetical protein
MARTPEGCECARGLHARLQGVVVVAVEHFFKKSQLVGMTGEKLA